MAETGTETGGSAAEVRALVARAQGGDREAL